MQINYKCFWWIDSRFKLLRRYLGGWYFLQSFAYRMVPGHNESQMVTLPRKYGIHSPLKFGFKKGMLELMPFLEKRKVHEKKAWDILSKH